MQIHDISISLLREYDNNPRNNDGAVDEVAASIFLDEALYCSAKGDEHCRLILSNIAKQ